MVTKKDYSNFVFDYSSAFEYHNPDLKMESFNRSRYKSPFIYQAISMQNDDDPEPCRKEPWPLILARKAIIFLTYLFVISIFPISLWICIKRVHALERLVLMRLGKMQNVYGPGIVIVLPCIDNWQKVDLNSKVFKLSTSQLLTSDGAIIEAETEVEYRVSDVLHYVTRLQDQENSLKDLSLRCLTNLVSEKDQEDLELNRELISCTLKNDLNNTVLNWGLEILNVFLGSVVVLKAAEPVDAIGTLISTLKAATGQSSDPTESAFPFLSSLVGGNIQQDKKPTFTQNSVGDIPQNSDLVQSIRHLVEDAIRRNGIKDLKSTIKLEIIGESTKVIYCCFDHGTALVSEGVNESLEPDVAVMLTNDNLTEFLTRKISPLQAYMDGKIMVTGDWTQLRSFSKVFQ